MSLTESQEQLLLALVGRVTELESRDIPNLSKFSTLSYVNNMFPLANTHISRSSDVTLRNTDPTVVIVDSSGVERTVTMPPASNGNKFYIIINDSDV